MKKFAFFTPVVKSLNVELTRIKKTGVRQLYAGVAAGDNINQMLALWDVNKATLKDNGVTNKREYLFNSKGREGLTKLGKSQAYDLVKVFKNRDKIEPYLEQAVSPSITDFLQHLSGAADKPEKPKNVVIHNEATGTKVKLPVDTLSPEEIELLAKLGMVC